MDYKKGIRRLVAETGLNQRELAATAGVSPATITGWSTGKVEPKVYLVERLVTTNDIKTSTFISWCEE